MESRRGRRLEIDFATIAPLGCEDLFFRDGLTLDLLVLLANDALGIRPSEQLEKERLFP